MKLLPLILTATVSLNAVADCNNEERGQDITQYYGCLSLNGIDICSDGGIRFERIDETLTLSGTGINGCEVKPIVFTCQYYPKNEMLADQIEIVKKIFQSSHDNTDNNLFRISAMEILAGYVPGINKKQIDHIAGSLAQRRSQFNSLRYWQIWEIVLAWERTLPRVAWGCASSGHLEASCNGANYSTMLKQDPLVEGKEPAFIWSRNTANGHNQYALWGESKDMHLDNECKDIDLDQF